jgi:uncharacterized protein YndB with AHSA1/START domain
MPAAPTAATSEELVITRQFHAPREVVFRAWSDPACLERWFAPHGCTLKVLHLDVRTGGTFHLCIQTPQGYECWSVGDYQEVLAPERLVYTIAVADEQGQRRDPIAAGMDPEWPAETRVTVTFEEQGGATLLTLHQTVDEALAKRTGAHPSWLQMLDRLATELPQD